MIPALQAYPDSVVSGSPQKTERNVVRAIEKMAKQNLKLRARG